MDERTQNNQKTLYESFFGGKEYSLSGPIFYLASGIICLFIVFGLLFTEIYLPDVVDNFQSIRPDISFPFFGILLILCISGGVIGVCFGLIGILWRNSKK